MKQVSSTKIVDLPLPLCGAIKHVYHISDIHIRNGDVSRSRYQEYERVLNRLFHFIKHDYDSIDSSVVVITGDVFHHKGKVESPAIKLFFTWLSRLSSLLPVYIIAGNHDFRQEAPDEPDLIETLLQVSIPNVVYIKDSGLYKAGDIGFGVCTVRDSLVQGSTQGIRDDLPDFPRFPKNIILRKKIALFHGTIGKTRWITQSENLSYPLEWISTAGYDALMLGDIHLQQVHNANPCGVQKPVALGRSGCHLIQKYVQSSPTDMIWAYAGSVVQQDFSEGILGHGFIKWNLLEDLVYAECIHVENQHGMITVKPNNDQDMILVEVKCHEQKSWLPLNAVAHAPWFPEVLNVRSTSADLSSKIEGVLHELGKRMTNVSLFVIGSKTDDDMVEPHEHDLERLNSPRAWYDYCRTIDTSLNVDVYEEWFTHPNTVLLPDRYCDFTSKAKERNERISKKVEAFESHMDGSSHSRRSTFKLKRMTWRGLLCYKDDCWFDFEKLDGSISGINAKNGSGKTSFLECIVIALFGEGFPSRQNKSCPASIICQKFCATKSDPATVCLCFDVSQTTYVLKRAFYKEAEKIYSVSKETYVINVGSEERIASGKQAVDKWLAKTFGGGIDSFLMSCMLSQSNDKDFFSMSSTEQKSMLDRALSIDSCSKFVDVIKESKLAHSVVLDMVVAARDALSSSVTIDCSGHYDNILTIQAEIEEHTKVIQQTSVRLNGVSGMFVGMPLTWFELSKDELGKMAHDRLNDVHEILCDESYTIGRIACIDSELTQLGEKNLSVCDCEEYHEPDMSKEECTRTLAKCKAWFSKRSTSINNLAIRKEDIATRHKTAIENLESSRMLKDELYGTKPPPKRGKDIDYNRWVEASQRIEGSDKTEIEGRLNVIVASLSDNPVRFNKAELNKMKTRLGQVAGKALEDCTFDVRHSLDLAKELSHLQTEKHRLECELVDLKKKLDETSVYPYNPECEACRQQPWKLHANHLEGCIVEAEKKLTHVQESLAVGLQGLDIEKTDDQLDTYIQSLEATLEYEELSNALTRHQQSIQLIEDEKRLRSILDDINYVEQWSDFWKEEIANEEARRVWCQKEAQWKRDAKAYETAYDIIKDAMELWEWTDKMDAASRDLDVWKKINRKKAYALSEESKKLAKQIIAYREWQTAKREQTEMIRALALYDDYKAYKELPLELESMHQQVSDLRVRLNTLELEFAEWTRTRVEIDRYRDMEEGLRSRTTALEKILGAMGEYHTWIYKTRVIPLLCTTANTYINMMGKRLALEGTYHEGTIEWYMKDGTNRPPIEKASGFQKFICGLGMRIALGRLGACGMRSKQLFIDEGFTACDYENLGKVPMFLKNLLGTYDSVVLVTHLEDLKSSLDMTIDITRDDNNHTSLLRF